MFRRLSPFVFNSLIDSLLCSVQGLPGTEGGGGGGATQGGAPPAQTPPAPAAGAAAPPAGAAPAGDSPDPKIGEPKWLPERLKQAKDSASREVLTSLGITDVEAGKKMLEEGKKALDAQKSEIQRKDEEINTLKPAKEKADRYGTYLQTQADTALAKLSEEQQTRVKSLAGDDPIKVLDAIALLIPGSAAAPGAPAGAPNGVQQPGQIGTPGQGTPPGAVPASTTGAHGAPPGAGSSPPNHLAIWEGLKDTNPFAASQYLLTHEREIVAARQSKTK